MHGGADRGTIPGNVVEALALGPEQGISRAFAWAFCNLSWTFEFIFGHVELGIGRAFTWAFGGNS